MSETYAEDLRGSYRQRPDRIKLPASITNLPSTANRINSLRSTGENNKARSMATTLQWCTALKQLMGCWEEKSHDMNPET